MIVTIVTFKLSQPASLADITKAFQATAPKYQGVGGLLRKNYWMSEDGPAAQAASMSGNRAPMRTGSTPPSGRNSSRASTAPSEAGFTKRQNVLIE